MNRTDPRRRIEELSRTGRSAGAIASILKSEGYTANASRASVGRVLKELRGPVRSPRVTSAGVPAAAPRPTAPRPRATPSRGVADDLAARAGSDLRELCADTPQLDPYLAGGASLVDALHSAGLLGGALTLSTPADVADLVALLVEDPCTFERGPEQSAAEFAEELRAAGEAERSRAIALLTGALDIVRTRAPATRYRA